MASIQRHGTLPGRDRGLKEKRERTTYASRRCLSVYAWFNTHPVELCLADVRLRRWLIYLGVESTFNLHK